jgi:molybdopterin molybdotransferase
MPELRPVRVHLGLILQRLATLPASAVPLRAGLGLTLARDVVSRTDLPGFTNSAMDGYAVRAADLDGAGPGSPVALPVDGDIAAGDTRHHVLRPGRTMRIMTGAPLPEGADAVVPVEDSDGGTGRAALTLAPAVGRHVRHRGEDVHVGDVVLRAGTLLSPGHLALAAAANVAELEVVRRPRVTVVSTGDELVPPGSELGHGQIVNSNEVMLAALVEAAGAELAGSAHLRDDADDMRAFLFDPPGDPDLLLTSGGVSMGAYDTVKEVLVADGGVEFAKVAMRPGMPQGFGLVGPRQTPIITLPGNPLSSLVSFHVFVVPALRKLAGQDPAGASQFAAVAGAAWRSVRSKTEFSRVVVEPVEGGLPRVRPFGGQGSHAVGALAESTALAIVPVEVTEVSEGMPLTCIPLLGQDRPLLGQDRPHVS